MSHSSFLRSDFKYPDQEGDSEDVNFNIDLEFLGVEFINLPSSFNGIRIKLSEKELCK